MKLLNSKALKRERQGKYIEKTVTTSTGKEIVEHFIFLTLLSLIREEVFEKIIKNVPKSKAKTKGY